MKMIKLTFQDNSSKEFEAGITTRQIVAEIYPKLVKKALKDMLTNLSEEELENAKRNIITSLNMIDDNPATLVNNYLFKNIANLKDVEERIKSVKKVSVQDIKLFAKKVKINTIYLLSGVK